jgi:hypothetical protein
VKRIKYHDFYILKVSSQAILSFGLVVLLKLKFKYMKTPFLQLPSCNPGF